VFLAQRVLKDLEVLAEKQVRLDPQVLKEQQVLLAQLVLPEHHQRCLDLQDLLELLAQQVQQAQPEKPDLRVQQVLKEFVVLLALLDHLEILDQQV
jgi:hypothetical protein